MPRHEKRVARDQLGRSRIHFTAALRERIFVARTQSGQILTSGRYECRFGLPELLQTYDAFFAAFFGALLLIDSILYLTNPRGVATSTVVPFLCPMSARPNGDSLEIR